MKSFKTIIMAAAAAMMFGACTGDQALPPLNKPAELGDMSLGDGQWNNPMAAYQAALGLVPHDEFGNEMSEAWVTGYIVGWVNVDISNANIELGADFTIPATVNTNIIIASKPDETDPLVVATVQLPSGAIRDALNLQSNPDNKGKLVTIYGQVGSKYCGQYGVRSVSDYKWGDEGVEPDPDMVLPSGSREVWGVDLTSGLHGFTFDQGNPATVGFETWKYDSKYGLVATGGNTSQGKAIATDAMAISPVIDLTNYTDPRVMVHQAANFFNGTANFTKMTQTLVRAEGETEWTAITFPYDNYGSSWNFSYTGYTSIGAFAGKKIRIAFRYTSTTSLSGTWEIDKVTVGGKYSAN